MTYEPPISPMGGKPSGLGGIVGGMSGSGGAAGGGGPGGPGGGGEPGAPGEPRKFEPRPPKPTLRPRRVYNGVKLRNRDGPDLSSWAAQRWMRSSPRATPSQ